MEIHLTDVKRVMKQKPGRVRATTKRHYDAIHYHVRLAKKNIHFSLRSLLLHNCFNRFFSQMFQTFFPFDF